MTFKILPLPLCCAHYCSESEPSMQDVLGSWSIASTKRLAVFLIDQYFFHALSSLSRIHILCSLFFDIHYFSTTMAQENQPLWTGNLMVKDAALNLNESWGNSGINQAVPHAVQRGKQRCKDTDDDDDDD